MKRIDSLANTFGYEGLNDLQVDQSRREHGENRIDKKESGFRDIVADLVKEPMLLLLAAACTIYFITGNTGDAIFMLAAIVLTTSISLYQDHRSRKALEALESLTEPECRVIRNGTIVWKPIAEIVSGDLFLAEEGSSVSADGIILHSNDFSVNESILTGESLPVIKASDTESNTVYQGTSVSSGLAICKATAIGINTALGKIGKSLDSIDEEDTPLQKQIRSFVRKMAFIGIIFFVGVWSVAFVRSWDLIGSLMRALSLAMSILPEEIPVAFTTFMAIGAWRLSKLGVIVKRTGTIETLGSATVICVDKTGTITKNKMELVSVYSFKNNSVLSPDAGNPEINEVIRMAMWASEPIPFDPMEIALHEAYKKLTTADERSLYRIIHEYPLGGKPPFMTHVFEDQSGNRIIGAKGAPEAIIGVCNLSLEETDRVKQVVEELSNSGARILGVAAGRFDRDNFPKDQRDIPFTFVGLVAFHDPPKDNMKSVLQSFYNAGIKVKIITGDHPKTALAIADQIDFRDRQKVLTGTELMDMDDRQLQEAVKTTGIFARMFPEAKLRILNALKSNGEIVAMTGDGVNDGPALKAAHIGVAMGVKGTQIAKEVSSLILSDDDLEKMVSAIAGGRKIYSNLKKAIQYIISIHIPIILTVSIPMILGWLYPAIFTPVHVIFLEMIMAPTCSIIYENEPLERSVMTQKPRPFVKTFFSGKELLISIVQGLIISLTVLGIYQYSVSHSFDEYLTRSLVFLTLISANIFLTLVNRSTDYPIWISIRYRNPWISGIVALAIVLAICIVYVPPVASFFDVCAVTLPQFLFCAGAGLLSVVWIEPLKAIRRRYLKSDFNQPAI